MIPVYRRPVVRSPVARQQFAVMSALVLLAACRSPGSIQGWRKAALPQTTAAATTTLSTESPQSTASLTESDLATDRIAAASSNSATTSSALINPAAAIPSGSGFPLGLVSRVDTSPLEQQKAPESKPVDSPNSASTNLLSASPVSATPISTTTVQHHEPAATETTMYASLAQKPPAARLVISGVRPVPGPVKIAIYASEQSFAALTDPIRTLQLVPDLATIETTVPLSGRVAVAVYQDINDDGELNRGRFGIPVEPFAFSNQAMGERGPPSFEQAAVRIPADSISPVTIYIQLP